MMRLKSTVSATSMGIGASPARDAWYAGASIVLKTALTLALAPGAFAGDPSVSVPPGRRQPAPTRETMPILTQISGGVQGQLLDTVSRCQRDSAGRVHCLLGAPVTTEGAESSARYEFGGEALLIGNDVSAVEIVDTLTKSRYYVPAQDVLDPNARRALSEKLLAATEKTDPGKPQPSLREVAERARRNEARYLPLLNELNQTDAKSRMNGRILVSLEPFRSRKTDVLDRARTQPAILDWTQFDPSTGGLAAPARPAADLLPVRAFPKTQGMKILDGVLAAKEDPARSSFLTNLARFQASAERGAEFRFTDPRQMYDLSRMEVFADATSLIARSDNFTASQLVPTRSTGASVCFADAADPRRTVCTTLEDLRREAGLLAGSNLSAETLRGIIADAKIPVSSPRRDAARARLGQAVSAIRFYAKASEPRDEAKLNLRDVQIRRFAPDVLVDPRDLPGETAAGGRRTARAMINGTRVRVTYGGDLDALSLAIAIQGQITGHSTGLEIVPAAAAPSPSPSPSPLTSGSPLPTEGAKPWGTSIYACLKTLATVESVLMDPTSGGLGASATASSPVTRHPGYFVRTEKGEAAVFVAAQNREAGKLGKSYLCSVRKPPVADASKSYFDQDRFCTTANLDRAATAVVTAAATENAGRDLAVPTVDQACGEPAKLACHLQDYAVHHVSDAGDAKTGGVSLPEPSDGSIPPNACVLQIGARTYYVSGLSRAQCASGASTPRPRALSCLSERNVPSSSNGAAWVGAGRGDATQSPTLRESVTSCDFAALDGLTFRAQATLAALKARSPSPTACAQLAQSLQATGQADDLAGRCRIDATMGRPDDAASPLAKMLAIRARTVSAGYTEIVESIRQRCADAFAPVRTGAAPSSDAAKPAN